MLRHSNSYITDCTCFIVLDEDDQQKLDTGLKIGGVSILNGEIETWSNSMLIQRILKTYGDDPVEDLEIRRLV